MRDRLIELLKGAEAKVTEMISTPLALEEWLGVYADHLLENGVIVPPCKVGETAYRVVKMYDGNRVVVKGEIIDIEVTNLINNTNEYTCYFSSKDDENDDSRHYSAKITFDDFGKTVFLTKEEAEKALKGDEGK